MDILHKEIQRYIDTYSTHLSPELEALERETYQKVLLPNMISGKDQGTFLYQFVAALKPNLVLELGTFTGYSAISMAMGMDKGSKLITLDINEEISYLPKKYFALCGVQDRIVYRIENAQTYIQTIQEDSLDLIFIDADKKNYPFYFEVLKPKLKSGGYILVDNVLWHGKVIEENITNKDTLAIIQMTKMMFEDKDFQCSIIPIRDGILIARKN